MVNPLPQASTVPKPVEPTPVVNLPQASTVPKPAANPWSQGAHYAVSGQRMSRQQSISSLPTTDSGISSLVSRSQSAVTYQRFGRRCLLSAVPDTANLAPMLRPDAGGSKGRAISVYTNHFPVKFDFNATVNQYDVDILLIDRDGNHRPARKDERWKVMQLISQKKKDFPIVW